jgi:DNA polymerase III subunit delta'
MTRIVPAELGPVSGHEAAKAAWREAVGGGRLHHGWLVRGPRGVGKCRLALQFALHLLGARSGSDLTADGTDPVGRLLLAGSHPDFRIIRRPIDDKGKEKSEIPVDSVRELAEFFSLRPAMGGWRVAIVDAVDELNRFGANALLKTLEEPPSQAMLILIGHGERLLPPTVRSRCRVLRLDPLSDTDTVQALEAAGISAGEADSVARLAQGRPGRALAVHEAELSGVDALRKAARGDRRGDAKGLQEALTQAAKSDMALSASLDALRIDLQAGARAESDPVRAGRLAAAALEVGRLSAEAPALNMDRAQTAAAALTSTARWLDAGRG